MTKTPPQIDGLRPRDALSEKDRTAMFGLLSQHFEGVTRDGFERDLSEKNWVVEIRRDGQLVGFSTLLVNEVCFDGEPLTAIFSGDTIVAPDAWGSPALARTWIAAVNRLRAAWPHRRCFWLLLTSGFRTYRFLPVFWRRFYPRWDAPAPPDAQNLLAYLATLRYGACYDAAAGLVRFAQAQRLRGSLSELPAGRFSNPHVAFFLARNPAYHAGDELVCLTEISEANLTPAGRRMVARPGE